MYAIENSVEFIEFENDEDVSDGTLDEPVIPDTDETEDNSSKSFIEIIM